MTNTTELPRVNILLVEDNPGDVRLMAEALKEGRVLNTLSVVSDGEEALEFLHRRGRYADASRPDIIFLDLNMPRKDGRAVLSEIKSDESLKKIVVIIMTTSEEEEDITMTYNLHANCFLTKPSDLEQFADIVRSIKNFWFTAVQLPPQ